MIYEPERERRTFERRAMGVRSKCGTKSNVSNDLTVGNFNQIDPRTPCPSEKGTVISPTPSVLQF